MSNEYQERYWSQLTQMRFNLIYTQKYAAKTEGINRAVNIILAVSSSGSIAGWAIWTHLDLVWAIIIATGQVIQAIKAYLPFQKQLKALRKFNTEMVEHTTFSEEKWYEVSEGMLSEHEIHKLIIDLRRRLDRSQATSFEEISIPDKEHLKDQAEKDTQAYFKSYYGLA